MRKSFLFLSFFILTGISFVCKGQYTGGNEDGSSYAMSTGSVCTPLVNANIYFGGVQDGSSSGALTASGCPVPVNANIYFGGIEDGSSSGSLAVSVCPVPVNANIYFGGVQDGFSLGALTASVCPVAVNANIYFGGSQDGYSAVYLPTLLASCLLPIELSSFTGICVNGRSSLSWSTATENNNAYFTIEYSPDGAGWQIAGTAPGAGNSSIPLSYSFTDQASRTGTAYYRLKQTDRDGKFTYSTIMSIGSCQGAGTDKLSIYPNPTAGPILLSYDGDKTKIQSIEIYNVLGERVYHSGVWQSGIDLSDWPAGIYFVHVLSNTRTEIREIVLKRY